MHNIAAAAGTRRRIFRKRFLAWSEMATAYLIDEPVVQTIAYQQDAGAKKEALNQARAA
jgi:hypothetical protein